MVSCHSRRRAAAGRTRGPPIRGGVQALPPLPPAACIMAWRESYLPPYAPCVMAASGLCLSLLTLTERGGPTAPGWAPRTPGAATPDWRVVGPAGARFEPPPPSFHLPRPPDPPPVPPLSPTPAGAARPAPAVRAHAAPCCIIRTVRAARRAEGPRTAPSAPPTMAGARGLAAPGGLLCRGGEATGRFIPAPNWGLCPRHRAQSPLGGYLTTTHHRTTGTRER